MSNTNSQGFTLDELKAVQEKFGPPAIQLESAGAYKRWLTNTPTDNPMVFCFPLREYRVHPNYLDAAKKLLGKPTEQAPFYMVLRKSGQSAPAVRHDTKEKAMIEAERLCRNSNEEYYVLAPVSIVKPIEVVKPVEWETI